MITLTNGTYVDNDLLEHLLMDNYGYKIVKFQKHHKDGYPATSVSVSKDENATVLPSIYLEPMIDRGDVAGEEQIAAMIDEIASTHNDDHEDVQDFVNNLSRDTILEKVKVFVQQQSTEDILKTRYCDLEAYMKIVFVDCKEKGLGLGLRITKDICNSFNITEKEIWEAAENNTFTSEDFVACPIYDIVLEIFKEQHTDPFAITSMAEQLEELKEVNKDMYVITNKSRTGGAVQVFNPKLTEWMKSVGLKQAVVIPSSKHEVIVMKVSDEMMQNPGGLECMINEVNHEQLAPGDVLSDHPYFIYADDGVLLPSIPNLSE